MSGPRVATALKVLAVLVIGAFVQTTFGNDLRVHGIAPDLMMLLAVSAGFSVLMTMGKWHTLVAGWWSWKKESVATGSS